MLSNYLPVLISPWKWPKVRREIPWSLWIHRCLHQMCGKRARRIWKRRHKERSYRRSKLKIDNFSTLFQPIYLQLLTFLNSSTLSCPLGQSLRNPLYHSWISASENSVLCFRSSNTSGFSLLFCFPIIKINRYINFVFYHLIIWKESLVNVKILPLLNVSFFLLQHFFAFKISQLSKILKYFIFKMLTKKIYK